ncbi:Hypothetical protein, putative [Bodo saltans]|uniref:WW domain-containing protein n=1 Tax=Bodo saltans TaxID=75058 RepID=A0A0S4INS5_BODSA|nr:Hypothetical protein, putative [Bodo saltans]|eukprot:CUF71493.1 Hypothetical protein, putative [Bodo saltans]
MDGAGGIIQSRYPHHLNTATGGMSNQPAQPIFETISATDLDAAVAAEARLMSTLRYGTIPIPKPSRPPLEAQTPSMSIASPAAGPRSRTNSTATLVSHNPTTVQNTVATPVVVVPPLVQNTAAAVAVQVLNRPSNGHETTSGGVSPLTPTSPMFSTPFTQSVPAVPAASVSNNARDPRAQLPLDVPIQQQDKSIALEAAKGIATPQVTPAQPQPSSMTPSTTLSTPLWREVPDAASGKSYYVHKETRKTTWNRSETDLDSKSNNKNTTVTPAVTPLAAPGQGWVAKQDPSSGKTFYFHPVTKKVTWKIAETLSASTEQQSPTGTVPLAAAAASSAVGPAAGAATTTVASPLGWIAKNDPSGKTYYSNSSLKKTTWKIEETDLDRNNAGSPKEQTAPSSSSASTATAPVPLATADGSPLPPNWKLVAPADGRSYYFNTITKKVQWTRPTE